eukprot:10758668-Prorocentrum_lima.AAC.1
MPARMFWVEEMGWSWKGPVHLCTQEEMISLTMETPKAIHVKILRQGKEAMGQQGLESSLQLQTST